MSKDQISVSPPQPEQAENDNYLYKLQEWFFYVQEIGVDRLKRLGDPEETPDGIIEPIETPEDLEGEAAIVTMPRGMKSDTPHIHHNEYEGHVVVSGSALMSKGEEKIDLQPGSWVVVEPDIPHFTIPSDNSDYVVIAVSFPGYNPENQVPVDLGNPPENFDLELYAEAQARE